MIAAVFLSLGSNVGDRKRLLDEAVARISVLPETTLRIRSAYYRTQPVGPVKDQGWFLNIAIGVETSLGTAELAAACHAIETALGRDRSKEIPSGPRPIDIDVLSAPLDTRAFVLVPLAEIAPDASFGGKKVKEHLAATEIRGVQKLAWPVPAI
ncbi:MAG: 2-amino-4-hydroxy-6-hydroxymethyldihydropteridine diphosphokinase [Bauldia sp.]